MAYQFDEEKIQDYYEGLAHLHTDVQHNVNGNKSFARFQSGAQINEIKKAAGKNIVVVADITGRRVGDKDDRMLRREIMLRFACYAANNTEEAKNAAIQKAEAIMFNWMTEMEKQQEEDLDQDIPCGIMHFLRPENFTWEPIEDQPWLLNHYGWDLTVPFNIWMPGHDASKWTNEFAGPGIEEDTPFKRSNRIAIFRVGAAGAPMNDGDTIYSNPAMINNNVIVLANGIKINELTDVDEERYVSKNIGDEDLVFHGGVKQGEVIEIYKV